MCIQKEAVALLAGLAFFSCSDHRSAGGNSAESGNPELAGVLTTASGAPVVRARVSCVPADFNALVDVLDSSRQTLTDSLGTYQFAVLPPGICALEAYDSASGQRALVSSLQIVDDTTLTVNQELSSPGIVRFGVSGLADGVQGWVVVPGTTIKRPVEVKFGSIYVDSLPAGEVGPLWFYREAADSVALADSCEVVSGTTQRVNVEPLHFSMRIPLNTTTAACNLTEKLEGFPLALKLDSSDLDFVAISPAEGRLRIWNGDSTKILPMQVGRWDAVVAKAQLWVRLDSLLPQNADQNLILVWDEEAVADDVAAGDVFTSADGFVAAWHFDDHVNTFGDMGPNGLHGDPVAVTTDAGVVGQGLFFDGRSSYVSIPGSEAGPLNIGYLDTAVFSIWVKIESAITSRFIFGKGTYQYYLKFLYPESWLFEVNDEQELAYRHWYRVPFDTTQDSQRWWHLTVEQLGAKARFYRNGELITETASTGLNPDSLSRYTGSTFEIGRRLFPNDSGDQFFHGILDELHVSDRERSSEWVRLMYLNQKPEDYWP